MTPEPHGVGEGRNACGARPLGGGDGARVLAVDVGLGTADILLTLPGEPLENAVRLVVPSRTQVVARELDAATAAGATVVFHGPLMGGGASGAAMKRHLAAGRRFIAGETAALTFADDLDRVRARGVEVVGDPEAAALADGADGSRTVAVRSGDLDVVGLRDALRRLGVEPRFDAVCVAVQDHGFSPHGSNRAFRFALWERAVAERRRLADLFYERPAIPAELTRLRAAADLGAELAGGGPVLAADTGPAALYGVLPDGGDAAVGGGGAGPAGGGDPAVGGGDAAVGGGAEVGGGDVVLVNVGNGHVVCVVARDGRLAGVFEHHTARLDGPGLTECLRRFLAGELTSASVREDGGHGAVLPPDALEDLSPAAAPGVAPGRRRAGGAPATTPILVTGPRREMLRGSGLPLEFAAPHGDMMLTGCHGLLRAARERGLAEAADPV